MSRLTRPTRRLDRGSAAGGHHRAPFPAHRTVACGGCGAAWDARRARFCGRCGAGLRHEERVGRDAAEHASDLGRARRVRTGWMVTVPSILAGIVLAATLGTAVATGDVAGWLDDEALTDPPTDADGTSAAADDRVRIPPPVTDDGARPSAPAGSEAPVPPESSELTAARWRYHSDATITAVRTVDHHLLVADADGGLTALDRRTGVQRWQARLSSSAVQLPDADPRSGLAIATTSMAEVIGIDVRSGIERWRTQVLGPAGSILLAPPGAEVVDHRDRDARRRPGEHFLRSSSDGGTAPTVLLSPTWTSPLVAVDGADGDQRWQATVDGRWVPIADGVIVTVDGGLERWELATGAPQWRVERPGEPIGRAGSFVMVRDGPEIAWIDPATGEERGRLPAAGTRWGDGPDGTMLLSTVTDDGAATLRAVDGGGADRWRRQLPPVPPDTPTNGCCIEVSTTADDHVLAVDRRGGRDLLLAADGRTIADLGSLVDDADRWVAGVSGDTVVVQGAGEVAGRSLATGDALWRLSETAFLASTEPVVVSTRSQVLAPTATTRSPTPARPDVVARAQPAGP